jgi:type I restriction-modification system DNA methylase subunit
LIEKYREIKAEYIKAHDGNQKKDLEKEITQLKKDISLITYGNDKVDKFDWSLDFAEVFADGGFDIVVANPPYVRMELFKDIKPTLKKNFPEIHSDRADLYCYFYGRALQLLRKGGMLAFISSNKWFKAKYGNNLKKYIANACQIYSIVDFGELPVFQSASTFPMIFICQNGKLADTSTTFTQVRSLNSPYPNVLQIIKENGYILHNDALKGSNWILADANTINQIKQMESASVLLKQYVDRRSRRCTLWLVNPP